MQLIMQQNNRYQGLLFNRQQLIAFCYQADNDEFV